jgi:hypothetical protein
VLSGVAMNHNGRTRSAAYPFCQAADRGELSCFCRQPEDRSELTFGVSDPGLTNQFVQQLKGCLRQTQQVQHLRDSRPADALTLGQLGAAVNHSFVEKPLELESQIDDAVVRRGLSRC